MTNLVFEKILNRIKVLVEIVYWLVEQKQENMVVSTECFKN